MARKIAKPLMEAVTKSDADLIAGDCHLVEHRDQGGHRQDAGRIRCRCSRGPTDSRSGDA